MSPNEDNFTSEPRHYSSSAKARAAAGSTAFAAALLLYFGFTSLEPTGNDLGAWSLWIFYHTLRIGGGVCACLAVLLWFGLSVMLIVDGTVAAAIGALLILTGAGMLLGGGYVPQAVINLLCGGMFASHGLQIVREYLASPSQHASSSVFNASPSKGEGRVRVRQTELAQAPHVESASLSNPSPFKVEGRVPAEPPQRTPPPNVESASLAKPSPFKGEGRVRVRQRPPASPTHVESAPEQSAGPPTEGYLAALAKKPKPTGDTPP